MIFHTVRVRFRATVDLDFDINGPSQMPSGSAIQKRLDWQASTACQPVDLGDRGLSIPASDFLVQAEGQYIIIQYSRFF